YKADDLELSQPYVFFYDKLEKCNWFLESMIELVDEPLDDRTVSFLLTDPAQDGGQWDMFVAIVEKYGVVPKKNFPESFHTSNTGQLNNLIKKKLRDYAHRIRQLHSDGVSGEEIRNHKSKMLEEIYKILAITIGEPPKAFDWQFQDKDGKLQTYNDLNPLEFYHKHIKVHLPDYVSIVNDPRNEYKKIYTVDYLGNVKGGRQVRHLNLGVDQLKALAAAALKEGKPVWFGCDVGQSHVRRSGVLDVEAIDYHSAFGFDLNLNKAQRLEYRESLMTHAMMFSGVHLDSDGKSGEDSGEKGFLCMSDRWFDEYLYQIVLNKKDLPKELVDLLDQEPVVLAPWDPMGALAQ
ncbi:bleomycin hydrolase, partial [Dimargaris cristalligena]